MLSLSVRPHLRMGREALHALRWSNRRDSRWMPHRKTLPEAAVSRAPTVPLSTLETPMKVLAINDFHNQRADLTLRGRVISPARVKRLRKEICPAACTCDRTKFWEVKRGEFVTSRLYAVIQSDGSILLED